MNDGITVTALILIVSFAIDRIAAAAFFLLSFLGPWNARFPDPALHSDEAKRLDAAKRLKLAYYVFVGLLAIAAVIQWDIRLLAYLGIPQASEFWDCAFSAMVLIGGSGQIAGLLDAPHASAPVKSTASEPIEIRGRITLDDYDARETGHRDS